MTMNICPICSGLLTKEPINQVVSTSPPHGRAMYGIEMNAIVHYVQCWTCGAYVQTPRMTDEDLTKYYASGDYRTWTGLTEEKSAQDERVRAKQDAKHLFRMGKFSKHLDVGCSRGYLLQEVGADKKVGVEPNLSSWTDDDNIDMVSNISLVFGTFDLVTVVHVLEHVPDPMVTLIECRKLLEKGGLLFVEVPSENSPGGWARIAHLYHFPTWTMHFIAQELGMKVVEMFKSPHLITVLQEA
jgi:SAM-dependent methyltransferase